MSLHIVGKSRRNGGVLALSKGIPSLVGCLIGREGPLTALESPMIMAEGFGAVGGDSETAFGELAVSRIVTARVVWRGSPMAFPLSQKLLRDLETLHAPFASGFHWLVPLT